MTDRTVFADAGLRPGQHPRAFDSIHIATALHDAVDLFLAYDQRRAVAAEATGLEVRTPGN